MIGDIVYLKYKNDIIAELIEGLSYGIKCIYKECYFLSSIEKLNYWLENRKTLLSREGARDLYKQGGIKTTRDFISVNKCLSVQDCYWVTSDINEKWSDVSFFSNSFSRVFTNIASGLSGFNGTVIKTPTPEFSIGGSSCKFLRYENGAIYLYKSFSGGLNELEYSGVYAEYLVTQLLEYLGVGYRINYDIVKYNERLFSKCKLFTSESINSVDICYLYDDAMHLDEHILHYTGRNRDYFRLMMIIDSLVYNVDRHDENIALLYSGDGVQIAPMYDFDHSLYWNVPLINRSKSYVLDCIRGDTPKTWVNHSFKEQFDYCMCKEWLDSINSLLRFRFTNHKIYKMNENRLKMINNVFQYNLREMLKGWI